MSARTIIRTVVTPRTVTRRVGPAGADAEGGGVSSFTDLTDKASADLPAINTPLATALGALSAQLSGKAPSSGISPEAISGTAVITTDPRLSDARTPTAHTHPASEISDATATGRSILTAANQAAARSSGLGSGATGDQLFTALTPAAAKETLGFRTFRTTADVSNSTQTPSNGNVPELTFPVVAGRTYKVDFCFLLAASGGSFVHQIRATYPTATLPALGDCLSLHRFTTKTPTPGPTSMDFNTSTAAAATSGAHSGYWFYRPSASGNVTFQIYNYDATAVTNTLRAGSTVAVTEL